MTDTTFRCGAMGPMEALACARAAPFVSAVIINHQSYEDTAGCIASLRQQTVPVQIVVVDNSSGSGDGIAVPQADRVLRVRNRGFGAAANLGARYCDGGVLLILNPDTRLMPDTIEHLANACIDDAFVAPRLVGWSGEWQACWRLVPNIPSIVGSRMPAHAWLRGQRDACLLVGVESRERVAEYALGACLAVRRDAWSALRGFDDRFFLYFEDTDICVRARREGIRLAFDSSVEVRHRHRRESLRSARLLAIQMRSAAIFYKRFPEFKFRKIRDMASAVDHP